MDKAPTTDTPAADPRAPEEWFAFVEHDRDRRWAAGDRVLAEEYLAAPPPGFDPELALQLVYGEFLLREQAGETPSVEEYQRRFPALAERLARQVELHRALGGSEASGTLPEGRSPWGSREEELRAVPGFELLGEIGKGGMGVVYRARDVSLNRAVAVKVLQERYAPDSLAARRFLDEARITGQLQHPGIPPIHAVGTQPDGRPFLAMKLIKGRTLADILADGSMTRAAMIAAFEQVCQAVGYAHDHGVIHRDLKPANVMVGAFGEVQVMDWGLAKFRGAVQPGTGGASVSTFHDPRQEHDDGMETRSGTILGTPAFMPPEQAAGATEEVDERADTFGLGAILCVILTDRPPFVGDTAETTRLLAARGKVDAAFARLDGCSAEPELIALCKRCLDPEKSGRPRSAGEVAAAVQQFRATSEERARRAELEREKAAVEAVEQRKRRRVQLALAAALAGLLAATGAFAWWRERQAAERRAIEARLTAEREGEARLRTMLARQGVEANRTLADGLRKQYKFQVADGVLAQAAEMAKGGAPELLPAIEQARRDLAFVVELDDIRYRKWVWVPEPGGGGDFRPETAVPKYRKAFADRGLKLETLDPAEAAKRLASSAVKAELVAAVDDWALHEPDEAVRKRLLEIARSADPGPWLDRLRDPAIRADKQAIAKLAADADPLATSSAALSVLATLMERTQQNPSRLLWVAHIKRPEDFELAFTLGQWHLFNPDNTQFLQRDGREISPYERDGREIGPYEAARALRPDNVGLLLTMGVSLHATRNLEGARALNEEALRLEPRSAHAYSNLGSILEDQGNLDGALAKYRSALELDPTDDMHHGTLGYLLLRIGRIPEAQVRLAEAARLSPRRWGPEGLHTKRLLKPPREAKPPAP